MYPSRWLGDFEVKDVSGLQWKWYDNRRLRILSSRRGAAFRWHRIDSVQHAV
jgi:hypothetical protein